MRKEKVEVEGENSNQTKSGTRNFPISGYFGGLALLTDVVQNCQNNRKRVIFLGLTIFEPTSDQSTRLV